MLGGLIFAVYVIGAIITAGAIGGIRDEMEGIADMIMVFVWPIAVPVMILIKIAELLYEFGKLFNKK